MSNITFTPSEQNLLRLLNIKTDTITKAVRRSDKEFDVNIEYTKVLRGKFIGGEWVHEGISSRLVGAKWDSFAVDTINASAWLPLLVLGSFYEAGYVADVEDMVCYRPHNDWSFVRDADPELIWTAFGHFARRLSKLPDVVRANIAQPDMPN